MKKEIVNNFSLDGDNKFNQIKDIISTMTDYDIEVYAERIQQTLYNRIQSLIKKEKDELQEKIIKIEKLEKSLVRIENRQLTIEK